MTETRKAYARPVLEELGTATDLTRTGSPGTADDFMDGSVTPGGGPAQGGGMG